MEDVPQEEIHMDWYILKVQSNRERSIAEALERKMRIEGLDRFFDQVIVPTEKVTEFKGGKKKVVERKLYPGYIVVHMHINDDTWFAVRETSGVGDFTGAAGQPMPMGEAEIKSMLALQSPEKAEPAKIKIDGKIMPVNKLEMTPKMVRQAAIELMDENLLETFTRELEVDFAISEAGLGRFRVNVFHQRGNVAMVLRYITAEMPQLDDLGMPEQLKDLVMLRRGLILMVGASGNGKSTTLAAMINHRNEKTSSHIITIEDPIEFLHPNKQSIVNQREVGLDTKSYANALKSAMRAAPVRIGTSDGSEWLFPSG